VNTAIAEQRLGNQCVSRPGCRQPEDVVTQLGAVQAQEYAAAKWALGLRMVAGTTDAAIERAFNDGRILRTHVMRPTWHFVTPADIHWMLELTAGRVHQAMAYANRYYELDLAVRIRATKIFERALSNGQHLMRAELGSHLARTGLMIKGVRLALLTIYAELEGVICSGRQEGKQLTYALLAQRAPRARRLARDEALAELTARYFSSHGPATVRDFVWWSGLTTAEARRGIEMSRAHREAIDGQTYWTLERAPAGRARRRRVHLLPIYDEYLVAYRDLDAVPRQAGTRGTLQQALVVGGQVAGTWKRTPNADGVVLDLIAPKRSIESERRALAGAVARYGRFLAMPVSLRMPDP
jgi:hypothetical protein